VIYQTLHLQFAQRKVPVYIGQGIFNNPDLLLVHIHGPRVVIVTQQNIADLYLESLRMALSQVQCEAVILPNGEQHKTIYSWQCILDHLIQMQHDRSTTLIALGGGVIGDVTGFAAACYQRGINYLQIPTTLIAQVDAAIGGKTAVNHALAKNQIGAIYQPQCVLADITLLQTLPARELSAGFAEVVKHGVAFDADFFEWLENNVAALITKSPPALLHAVYMSAKIKGQIVIQDEHDNGLRHLLNFGHTFGHALEAAGKYQQLLHGEAVALGMMLAAKLSVQLSGLSHQAMTRLQLLLQALALPVTIELPPFTELLTLLQRDKKIRAGTLSFILLSALGRAIKTTRVTTADIANLLTNPWQHTQSEQRALL
jgi:3-dehydroquinate synthase